MGGKRIWFALALCLALPAATHAGESLRLEAARGGNATVVDARTLAAGDTLRVWAARYDSLGIYVDGPEADWDLTGSAVTLDATHGSSVLLQARTLGTSTLAARADGLETAAAMLSVLAGAPRKLVVRAAPGAGSLLTALDLASDSNMVLYAGAHDAFGNWAGAMAVDWSVTPARGVVTPAHAALTVLVATTAGTGTLLATAPGLTSAALPLVVRPGVPATLRIETADGNPLGDATLTIGATLDVFARLSDARGNSITPVPVTWVVSGIGATCAPAVGPSTTLRAERPGTVRLEARAGSLQATSGLVAVVGGAITRLRLSQAPDAWVPLTARTVDADATLELFALGEDASGFLLGPVDATWSSTNAAVARTTALAASHRSDIEAGRIGNARIAIARAGAAPDTSAVLNVVAGQLAHLAIETADGNPLGDATLTIGATLAVFARPSDAHGNSITSVPVTWAVSGIGATCAPAVGPSTTLRAERPGTVRLEARAGSLQATSGLVAVVGGAITRLRLSQAPDAWVPLTARTVDADATLELFALGEDASGFLLGPVDATWSSTNAAVARTTALAASSRSDIEAGRIGNARIAIARAGAAPDTSAALNVAAGKLARLTIETQSDGTGSPIGARTLSSDSTLVLCAVGRDADGNFTGPRAATWAVSGNIGTLSTTAASQTILVASHPGTGLVTAADALHVAASGPITVTTGAAHHVQVTDATNTPFAPRLMRPGDACTARARWRDADDNALGAANVQWSWNGDALASLPLSPAEAVTWTAQRTGRGRLVATPAGAAADTSAWITVTTGAITRLAIALDDIPLVTATIAADSSLELHAQAFDSGNNALGEVPVTWIVASHDGTATVEPSTGSATRLVPQRAGDATLVARHASGVEAESELTFVPGRAARVWIETRADGSGSAVPSQALDAGARVELFAIARDVRGNAIGSMDVGWIVEGGIGVAEPGFGSLTWFKATRPGNGRVRAVHATLPGDATGTFTVTPAAPVALSLERALGAPLVDVRMTADDSLAVRAMGRDAFGNATGLVDATWSVVEGTEFGSFGPGSNPRFHPHRAGTVHVRANWNGLIAVSESFVVTAGNPAGAIPMQASPGSLRADGQSRARVTLGPVHDAHGNLVDDGTLVTLAALGCRLESEFGNTLSQVSTVSGVAAFDAVAPGTTGTAHITATSGANSGSAQGALEIAVFPAVTVALEAITPATVFRDRAWTPAWALRATGSDGMTLAHAVCTVDDGNGGTWSTALANPTLLGSDAPTPLAFPAMEIPSTAHAGHYAPRLRLDGTDANGHAWAQDLGLPPGSLTVTEARLLAVRTATATIERTDSLQVEVECEVAAGSLQIDDMALVFDHPEDWDTTWIGPPLGTVLMAGSVHVLRAVAVPRSTARLGAALLDARVTFRAGTETSAIAGAARTARIEVIAPAPVLAAFTPSQSTVVADQGAPAGIWWLDLAVENRGSAAFECTGLDVTALVEGIDRRAEFVFAPSLAFRRTGTPRLASGATDTLRVGVNRTGTSLGVLRVRAVLATRDVASGIPLAPIERVSPAIAIQRPADFTAGVLAVDATHLVAGTHRPWTIACTVENRGGADLRLEPPVLILRQNGVDRTSVFAVQGPGATLLAPGATRTLVFTCTGAPAEPGAIEVKLQLTAIETASLRRIETLRIAAGPTIETAADLVVASVTPRRASRGAPVRFEIQLTNRGTATAHLDTTSALVVDSLRAALPLPLSVATGDTVTALLRQIVPGESQPLGMRALTFAVRGTQDGEPLFADVDAESLMIEAPPALTILGVGTSQPTVTREQTQPWDLSVVVRNDGQADYRIETAAVQVYVDGIDRTPTYAIALHKPFGTPLVPASLDTLRFRVTRTGPHTGPATLEASVTARDANSGRRVEANTFLGGKGSVRVQAPGILVADSLRLDAAVATSGQARPVKAWLTLRNAGEAVLVLDPVALQSALTTTPFVPVQTAITNPLILSGGEAARVRFELGPMTAAPGIITVGALVRAWEPNRGVELTAMAQTTLSIASPAEIIVTRTSSPARVTAGSTRPWTMRFRLANRGGSAATLSDARLVTQGAPRFEFAPLVGLQGGGWTLQGGATDSLKVTVVHTDSIAGITSLQLASRATEATSGRTFDLVPGAPATLLVQDIASLVAVDSTLAPRAASRGQEITLRVALVNEGGSTVRLDPTRTRARLVGSSHGAALAQAVVIPPGNPVWLEFAPSVLGADVEAGPQQVALELAGEENDNPWSAVLVLGTPLQVDPAAHLEVMAVRSATALVTAGQTRPWNVSIAVRNPGAPVRFESASLACMLGTEDVSDDYDIVRAGMGLGSGAALLVTGATDTLQFTVRRTGMRTGLVVLDVEVRARDANSNAEIVLRSHGAARGSVRVASPAQPRLIAAVPSQGRISVGQRAAWKVGLTVRNDGGTSWAPDWSTAALQLGNATDDVIVMPSGFDVDQATLEPGATATATFQVRTTGIELGQRDLRVRLAGRQTTDATTIEAGPHPTAGVTAERPAQLQLVGMQSTWARPGFLNTGQTWPVAFTLANVGEADCTARLRMQCTNATPAESLLTVTLAGSASRTVTLTLGAADRHGAISIRLEAEHATDSNDSTQTQAWNTRPAGELQGEVQTPGELRLAMLASQARVSAGQTAPWWVDLEVENTGEEPLQLDAPRGADLEFERASVPQSDYLVEPPAGLVSSGLTLEGGARGTLRYRITQAGRQSGEVQVRAALTAAHANEPASEPSRAEAATQIAVDGEPGLRILTTESITWRRTRGFDNFRVHRGQRFVVRVTIANTGGTPLDSIRVALSSQHGNSNIAGSGRLAALAAGASADVEFAVTAGTQLSEAGLPETFVAHVVAARDHHSDRDVEPSAALDATTFATIEMPSALALDAWIASPDGARGGILSPGQEFVIAARVVNQGQSSVNDAGRVRLDLPAGFVSATDPLEHFFVPGETATWTLHASSAATVAPESLQVGIAALPQDQTSGDAAGVTRSAAALGVEVRDLNALTAVLAIEDPDGARDGVVSAGQALHVSLVVRGDVDLIDRRARFQLPAGWRGDPNQPTKDALPAVPESRTGWDFAAGDAVGAAGIVVRIEARDRRSGAAFVAVDTLDVVVASPARLGIAAAIVSPVEARGGRLVPGGSFTLRAIVRETGTAGLAARPDGTHGRLRLLDLPSAYGINGVTRDFTLDAQGMAAVEWHAIAPAAYGPEIASTRIVFDILPLDANTGLVVALDPDSSQARLALTLVDAALHVRSETSTSAARLAGETRVPLLDLVVRNDADRPARLDSLGLCVQLNGVAVAAMQGLAGLHITFEASPSNASSSFSQPILGDDAWLGFPGDAGAIWIAPGAELRGALQGDLALTAAGAAVSVSVRGVDGAPRVRARAGGAAIAARADARDALASAPLRVVAATQPSYAAPNPFHFGRESTAIHYGTAGAGTVQIRIYTLQGGLVWERSAEESAGGPALRHVAWDGRNGAGAPVRNGVYVCRVSTGARTDTFKIAVLR